MQSDEGVSANILMKQIIYKDYKRRDAIGERQKLQQSENFYGRLYIPTIHMVAKGKSRMGK